jgi:hypothetical protein
LVEEEEGSEQRDGIEKGSGEGKQREVAERGSKRIWNRGQQ